MSNPSSNSPTTKREQARKQYQRVITSLVAAGIGIILIGLTWYFIADAGSAQTNFGYKAADVSHNRPMQAIHETGEVGLDAIPFLPKDGPQPKIVLLEDFHDFGNVSPTEIATHEFVIANQGDAPLTISRAYTTCGCTTANFTATIIPPGKISVVTLQYDAGYHDARGQTVRRGIIIENNDPLNPQVELWAQASVQENP